MSLSTTTVTPAELAGRPQLDGKVRLLDVRTPGEFAAARIPGSHNVPLPDLPRYAADIAAGPAAELVLVCQSGARAGQASDVLREHGYDRARVLAGGLAAWQAAGGEVATGQRSAWTIERQVRLVAGSLVAGSILASLRFPKARFLAGGVGSGLVIAALTNTCLMGTLLAKLPHNRASGGDVEAAVAELTG
jgi:rhodanese-related sulfurtransferase